MVTASSFHSGCNQAVPLELSKRPTSWKLSSLRQVARGAQWPVRETLTTQLERVPAEFRTLPGRQQQGRRSHPVGQDQNAGPVARVMSGRCPNQLGIRQPARLPVTATRPETKEANPVRVIRIPAHLKAQHPLGQVNERRP